VVVQGDPDSSPYEGPMNLPIDYRDRATVGERSGAAGRALECDGAPYDGGGADYDSGLASVQDSPPAALDNLFEEDVFGALPEEGYRIEREHDGRVLFSYDVGGRTKIAFFAFDSVTDYNGDEGWGVEAWAECDPSELPATVTDDLGIQVWEDSSGQRAPGTRIQSFQGAEHCDWQDITFLHLGRGSGTDEYVRDRHGELAGFLRASYDGAATLPHNATNTGLHRDERELWLASTHDAASWSASTTPTTSRGGRHRSSPSAACDHGLPGQSIELICRRPGGHPLMPLIGHWSFGHGVAMAMGYPPIAPLAAVHLGGPQTVGARLTVDRGRGVLESGGIGHVARYVVRHQLERIRRAVGETLPEGGEQLVELSLAIGVAPCTQDAHGLVARPKRPAGGWVAVVQRELRLVQRGLDPRQEIVTVDHAFSILRVERCVHACAVHCARAASVDNRICRTATALATAFRWPLRDRRCHHGHHNRGEAGQGSLP